LFKARLLCAFIAILILNACTSKISGVRITDLADNTITFNSTQDDSMIVVVWLAADCPISQKQVLTLNGLIQYFPTVSFAGVFTHWDKTPDIQQFKRDFAPNFPLFRDGNRELFKKLKPVVTPEVQLIADGKIVYRGAIDNWYYALGRHRAEPNEHYLKAAIQAALNHQPVIRPFTTSVGCRIE